MSKISRKRPWRKLVKKLQRKRKRQKLARQRDNEIEEAELEKLNDPLYKSWLEQQEEIARQQQLAEENQRQEQEELWLRSELLAQKQFKKDELKRKAEEARLEAERLKQEEKLKVQEEDLKNKHNEIKLQAEKAAKEFDDIMTSMMNYLENVTMKTPARLDINVESRPGDKPCGFFEKTNCCRFDPSCTFNHIRPMLAKTILIKHFFQHPLLEQQGHNEYSRSDSELELSERDLREAYDEFCEDVWPVLEEFGSIVNFRTIRNIHSHLRGHVFVEYTEKRPALKAFISLQNRYYASKRLNVEFSNIRQWHKGVCGMRSFKGPSLSRKCLKEDKCNFLHLMKNINNKYNQPIDNPERSMRNAQSTEGLRETSLVTSWNCEDNHKSNISVSRNWRWSESPEMELKSITSGENSQNIISTEKSSYSVQRTPACRAATSYTTEKKTTSSSNQISDFDATSSKRRSKCLHSSHHKSETNSSTTDTKHFKRSKSKDRTRSSSQRRKSSRRESSASESNYHKSLKKTKYKSPTSGKKRKKSDKKSDRKSLERKNSTKKKMKK